MKTIIITGAGSGIGRSCALKLLSEGHSVVLAGRREETLKETASLSGDNSHRALAVTTDITNEDSVANLFSKAVETFGRIDVLFNNAGIAYQPIPLENMDLERWQQMVDTNLTGAFLCIREAFRVMKAQDPQGGRIINNGSLTTHLPRPGSVAYVATKHGVTGLSSSLALDGRRYQIACSQIDIGNATTGMTDCMQQGVLQADGSTATEPTISATHVADAIAYIVGLPLQANVPSITVMATQMPYAGRG